MTTENFAMWYSVFGVLVVILNGAVRKLDHDMLLAFAWFVCWWMTPLALFIKLMEKLHSVTETYQPLRRLKIFFNRNF